MDNKKHISLQYLFFTFLKIGTISWGGFMALISVVQKQLVEKDKVIEDEVILDSISLASILPGPVAFNVVINIGYFLRGIKGALVSMIAILLPSFVFITILSWLYFTFDELPLFNKFFLGILPAIAAIIISVALNMIKKHVKDYKQIIVLICAGIALIFFHSFFTTLFIILAGGLAGYLIYGKSAAINSSKIFQEEKKESWQTWIYIAAGFALFFIVLWFLPNLFKGSFFHKIEIIRNLIFTFAGMSLTLFGGGYVIIPAIQTVVVDGLQWLTVKEFADAIALGQVTPGPIFISAAFIGYKVFGLAGAFAATLAIFTPPGMLMIFCSRFISQMKQSSIINAIYKGIRPAVIGMIFSAAFTIGKSVELRWETLSIFVLVVILSVKFKINVVYLIPASGIIGLLLF
ncbi:MAG: chromate efflux transporter [Draconibacterium sp.]|nr:chromate efflux transporter [Draconibacterium sp.]